MTDRQAREYEREAREFLDQFVFSDGLTVRLREMVTPTLADWLRQRDQEHARLLADAAMLLRMVVARKGELFCLRDKIAEWLKENGLEGSVVR